MIDSLGASATGLLMVIDSTLKPIPRPDAPASDRERGNSDPDGLPLNIRAGLGGMMPGTGPPSANSAATSAMPPAANP